MQLSKRLQRIADYVRPGDRVVDVGTDHAYIPIWLLLNGVATQVCATDIRSGPLERARVDAEYYGVADQLMLLQCDGLAKTQPQDVDTIIIAGMGGESIIGILAAAPWSLGKRLILQPQTKQAELRIWLADSGYRISDAVLVYDTGRIYLVWLVEAGEMPEFRGVDAPLLAHRDTLLKPYLEEQLKRLRKRLCGIESAVNGEKTQKEALRIELAALEEIYREVSEWQT